MISESSSLEIWDRLIQGKPLDGLQLSTVEGRLDLRGLELPDPMVMRRFEFKDRQITEMQPSLEVRNSAWKNLDFSGSKLNGMRLFGCEIENCRFDDCNLEGLRMWSMKIRSTSFRKTSLRNSALGNVDNGVRNLFDRVDFTNTDFRGTTYRAAAFENCIFRNAKLIKLDFQSSTFVDCSFEGMLTDVLFYRRGYKSEEFPANEMKNIDFSHASLHDVGFHDLVLDKVKFPTDDQHVIIKWFDSSLDRMIESFEQQGDPLAKKLIFFTKIFRKRAAVNQAQGVINLIDLKQSLGDEGVTRFLSAIPT